MTTEEPTKGTTEFMEDLIQLQSEIHNPSNTATNPFLKSKYAPLNEILNMVRPLCNKHGFFLFQDISGDGEFVTVETNILHRTGHSIRSGELEIKPDKKGIQGAGAAITYMRRYQLLSLLGIAGEDDNDGEGSKDTVNEPAKTSKTVKQPKSAKASKTTKKVPKSTQKSSDESEVLPDYNTVAKESAVFRIIQEEIKTRDLVLCDDNIIEIGSDLVGQRTITPGDFTVVRKKLGLEV
ncbi:MAG TPA: ERF family protein [Methanobacteriaceae archaeon]|nr:ERF family protein [Methanobacteriaceae archaeon]HNS25839.1 ERF family protein [Methanobacteriaceae archaeon]